MPLAAERHMDIREFLRVYLVEPFVLVSNFFLRLINNNQGIAAI